MWKKTEPLRSWLYTVAFPVLAFLAYRGVVTGDEVELITAIASAVLGVGVVEGVRLKVTPEAKKAAWNKDV